MVDRRSYEEVIAEREKNAHQPKPYEAGHENHLEKAFPLPPMPDKFRGMRIFCTLLALFLVVYGAYGLAIDHLVLPVRRGAAKHLHGVNAWVAMVGLYFAAAALWMLVLDLRPDRLGRRRFIIRALVAAALICQLAAPFF